VTIERIGVAEAKRRFSELADRVGRGESFVIMRRGRPVVALVAPQRATDEEHQPSLGLAAFPGALANEWDTVDDDMAEIIAARQQVSDRRAPELT
jgi:prevent-host-death family protein